MLILGRLLIVAAAMVMLACALFVLGSIAVRMRHGHWLRRAGPFEISENAVDEVAQQARALAGALVAQEHKLLGVEGALEDTKRAMTDLESPDS